LASPVTSRLKPTLGSKDTEFGIVPVLNFSPSAKLKLVTTGFSRAVFTNETQPLKPK
jgi:hypothetical protein